MRSSYISIHVSILPGACVVATVVVVGGSVVGIVEGENVISAVISSGGSVNGGDAVVSTTAAACTHTYTA
jgi:hypothetical protein